MYWWIKDVFVERHSNNQVEARFIKPQAKKLHSVNVYRKLKAVLGSQIEHYKQRIELKRSQRLLSQLDAYYLRDIGLTQEQVYLMGQGIIPQRFKENELNLKSAKLDLIETPRQRDKPVTGQALFDPVELEKAA